MIVAYVSGHGFGHATRTAEVLRLVREQAPAVPLCMVGSAPARVLTGSIEGEVALRTEECDVGLVQRGPLEIDEAASLERWRRFTSDWGEKVAREQQWLRDIGARVVLGDVPPLAFEAAARAGVPSVALANFSWDWIYRHLAARQAGLLQAAEWAGSAYSKATLLLRLPFAGDLSAFPNVEDVPLVARRPRVAPTESRRRLDLPSERVVLWSFGGHALAGFDYDVLGQLGRFHFVVTDTTGEFPANVTRVSDGQLERLGLSYVDLLAAADVVVTKPGYGIVSDALGARTRLVYTDRGDFPEYPILARAMPKCMPCAYVSNEDLISGRLAAALDAVMDLPWPEAPPLDGASVAARRLLEIGGFPYIPTKANSGIA